jgi:hypothetical protein
MEHPLRRTSVINRPIHYEEYADEEVIVIPRRQSRQFLHEPNEFDPFDGGSRIVRSGGSYRVPRYIFLNFIVKEHE